MSMENLWYDGVYWIVFSTNRCGSVCFTEHDDRADAMQRASYWKKVRSTSIRIVKKRKRFRIDEAVKRCRQALAKGIELWFADVRITPDLEHSWLKLTSHENSTVLFPTFVHYALEDCAPTFSAKEMVLKYIVATPKDAERLDAQIKKRRGVEDEF